MTDRTQQLKLVAALREVLAERVDSECDAAVRAGANIGARLAGNRIRCAWSDERLLDAALVRVR